MKLTRRITADEIIDVCRGLAALDGVWLYAGLINDTLPITSALLVVYVNDERHGIESPTQQWVVCTHREPGTQRVSAKQAAEQAIVWLFLRWLENVRCVPQLCPTLLHCVQHFGRSAQKGKVRA